LVLARSLREQVELQGATGCDHGKEWVSWSWSTSDRLGFERFPTIPTPMSPPCRRDSNQGVSGIPGAVHTTAVNLDELAARYADPNYWTAALKNQ
ncbi:hypothetical protein, partial [Acidovorax sp. SUPP3334]|uniref:hypothetical protein n=1 Tax=Acidovorax sp. SUPP3334 TaxID=2920881 RepID=UPI0024E0E662